MKISEIRQMKEAELHSELDRLRRHLFDLRSQAVTEKLEDPSLLTKAKRDIARILTVLREKGGSQIEERQAHLEAVAAKRGKR
ncbi:MAG TPA: 50S ribosomal protein L29 [Phycisphaerae bacterium]|jgi:large subunit ribosomal protein L29|nr:50S ribosomal protein L29 [Phycisphaerae bacterium]HOB75751.1 50S ribosomal protein L29 [Phycisphaerae bacterium]HOJ55617.1 50S ribosomal protein L29 [Phycisphaerae bacterium]HOL27687.1 50S ribosomal protein L29 [Phycisphaerae bacterium]HPP21931.1 50S ribosomal protein L29 [Phycisphaerae bacterium]